MNSVQAIALVVLKEMIRRKDFYVLFIITVLLALLMAFINIFNDQSIAGYLTDIALLLIWICSLVMAITTTARQLHSEKENRTIFPLLAKPVSRAQLLLGKFLGCWMACGVALLVFYLFLGILVASREHTIDVGSYAVAVFLHWGALAVVVGMALLGSIVFAAPSSNGTICFIVSFGILWLAGHLNTIALRVGGISGKLIYAVYFLTPRLDWASDVRQFLVFHSPMPGLLYWLGAMFYYGVYTSVLLLSAWLLFRRRALNT